VAGCWWWGVGLPVQEQQLPQVLALAQCEGPEAEPAARWCRRPVLPRYFQTRHGQGQVLVAAAAKPLELSCLSRQRHCSRMRFRWLSLAEEEPLGFRHEKLASPMQPGKTFCWLEKCEMTFSTKKISSSGIVLEPEFSIAWNFLFIGAFFVWAEAI
jgi:hypothetical protein